MARPVPAPGAIANLHFTKLLEMRGKAISCLPIYYKGRLQHNLYHKLAKQIAVPNQLEPMSCVRFASWHRCLSFMAKIARLCSTPQMPMQIIDTSPLPVATIRKRSARLPARAPSWARHPVRGVIISRPPAGER